MIIGIFQRHYKIYKGLSFIPFHSEAPSSLTMILGNNGAGKSSILEALDTFFNNRSFNVNIGSKKSEAFVAPLFLLDRVEAEASPLNLNYCHEISEFLWEVEMGHTANYRQLKDFFEYRDNYLQELRNSHYLLTFSKENENNNLIFFTFTNPINVRLNALNHVKDHNHYLACLKSIYKYIYIPIETSIEEFLRLETKGMQSLVDKKIADEIDTTLNEKAILTRRRNGKQQAISLIDIINQNLSGYIDKTEIIIKRLYEGYDFKMQHKQKQNLTSNDIKDQIIYSYLSKRTLKRDNKPIKDLSAGERKKALIDIAYSFINSGHSRNSNIVFAVDEPESSLHISNCYEQFKRIQDISTADRCQVLLSTHWYGSLQLIEKGSLLHVELDKYDIPRLKHFTSKSYLEEKRNFPSDIILKSQFDLTSSIISSMKYNNTNWLIVEGYDDYLYLNQCLEVDNLKILPVGGCGNVKVLYDFLYTPISYKSEVDGINGKIFCLIDTDENGPVLELGSDTRNKKMRFRRLQMKNNRIELVKNDDQLRFRTTVEECLDPFTFFQTIFEISNFKSNYILSQKIEKVYVHADAKYSMIDGDNSMLGSDHFNTRDFNLLRKEINEFIIENKESISKKYTELNDTKVKMPWMERIEDFFNS
jgi:ABC-type cobalamin/Fe3+-siderophores transport system ATPase subunit